MLLLATIALTTSGGAGFWVLGGLALLFVGTMTIDYALKSSLNDTLSGSTVPFIASTGSNILTFNGMDRSGTLDGSASYPVTSGAAFQKAMVAGAGTIDLTALTHRGTTVDLTGKRVQIAHFRNPSTNTGNITVKFGAANPYNLLGASWTIVLIPGQEINVFGFNVAPLVAGGAKNIDISGTGTEALDCIIAAG